MKNVAEITITAHRFNGDNIELPTRKVSIGAALKSLLYFELGFGGQITKWEPTHIEVQTHVFSTCDTTVFSGLEADMTPLHEAAYVYVTTQKNSIDADIDQFIKVTGGNTLLVTCARGGMPEVLLGNRRAEVIGCFVATKDETLTKKVVTVFNSKKSYEDVFAFVDLVYCEGVEAAKTLLEAG